MNNMHYNPAFRHPSLQGYSPFDLDTFISKQYRAYLKQRPMIPLNDLSFLKPADWIIPSSMEKREFLVQDIWDNPLPDDFAPLNNEIVQEYTGVLERPLYDRYFRPTGTEKVVCPRTSMAVLSPINLKLSYPLSLPDGFDYVFTQEPSPEYPEGGFIYIIPKGYLEELEPYTLVLSRSKVKCEESYTVAMSFNATLYVSIVRVNPFTSRYKGTYVVPLWAMRGCEGPQFAPVIEMLFSYWISMGYMEDPSVYTLSTGECLNVTHQQY